MANNPHDAFTKGFLGNTEIAKDFFARLLPPEIVSVLNLDNLTLENSEHIDEQLTKPRAT